MSSAKGRLFSLGLIELIDNKSALGQVMILIQNMRQVMYLNQWWPNPRCINASPRMNASPDLNVLKHQVHRLLTWINFNPSMGK